MMTLRYTCETKYSKVFNGSKKVRDVAEADKRVSSMLAINIKEGYGKYGNFKLYDSKNNQVTPF